jgi:CBS domain-containing protein
MPKDRAMTAAPTARDLMTRNVVGVPPETPVAAVARLLAERGISAVPVLDGTGAVLGVVNEADLIRRLADEGERPRGWLADLFEDPYAAAARYARAHGATAADVMTRPVVAVAEETSIAHVARLMEEKGIRRVLVLAEDGRLRGLVSRADLLRALASPPPAEGDASDEGIRRAVLAAMRGQPWADAFHTMVEVKDGVVHLHGFARSEAVRRALHVLAEGVLGVRGVVDATRPLPAHLYGGA